MAALSHPPDRLDPGGELDEAEAEASGQRWMVYVLVSADGRRTYVGITCDVSRRLSQHNGALPGGARSTRSGRPWAVGAVFGPVLTRGEALRMEAAIKRRRGQARLVQ